ncbi:prephenate dehydratase [Rhizomicrobium palustre]|uniref:prephenate dehydratase n=1 Tax=Rhizomicrobium palustre TaxID=189966 RepID=A0A846MX16_9PROT|nr:prephenate dehydratase [Rhizomicrobium palustre]NIK87873.1 prephenate dehydratase [Rhizomicrobium palustre]
MSTLIARAKTVAFQGEAGAYANLAAKEAIPHAEFIGKPTFEAALEAVRQGETDLAFVPVENSVYGRIADVHQLVRHFGRAVKGFVPDKGGRDLFILGEHFHRVRHQLLGVKGAKLEDVKTVYSQAPALGQVRKVVKELGLVEKQWYDTAGSARHVAELGDPTCAAVASSLAGEIYGLDILKADIEDASNNMTRFLIVGGEPEDPPNDGSAVITTFLFGVRNIPAALYKALGGFATNGVNMTKLESYQLGGSFNATEFYADIEGHPDSRNVRLALEELSFFSSRVIMLGIYPAHPYRNEMP